MAGTLPAVRASNANVAEVMNDEARGSSSMRMGRISKALVIGQLAVSCGLLVSAGLMIRTVINVTRFDYGFTTTNILTARLGLFEKDYPTKAAQLRFYDELTSRLEGRPGIRAVALTSDLPARGGQLQPVHDRRRRLPDATGPSPRPPDRHHPRLLRHRRRAARAGAGLRRTDGPDAEPVAIVNERFAELLFPGRDPLGSRVKLGDDDAPWRTIVGMVRTCIWEAPSARTIPVTRASTSRWRRTSSTS